MSVYGYLHPTICHPGYSHGKTRRYCVHKEMSINCLPVFEMSQSFGHISFETEHLMSLKCHKTMLTTEIPLNYQLRTGSTSSLSTPTLSLFPKRYWTTGFTFCFPRWRWSTNREPVRTSSLSAPNRSPLLEIQRTTEVPSRLPECHYTTDWFPRRRRASRWHWTYLSVLEVTYVLCLQQQNGRCMTMTVLKLKKQSACL